MKEYLDSIVEHLRSKNFTNVFYHTFSDRVVFYFTINTRVRTIDKSIYVKVKDLQYYFEKEQIPEILV